MVANNEVPVIQVSFQTRVRKVTSADHYVIAAQNEAVIDVFMGRQAYDDFSSEVQYINEPTHHFQETYPLQMASILI